MDPAKKSSSGGEDDNNVKQTEENTPEIVSSEPTPTEVAAAKAVAGEEADDAPKTDEPKDGAVSDSEVAADAAVDTSVTAAEAKPDDTAATDAAEPEVAVEPSAEATPVAADPDIAAEEKPTEATPDTSPEVPVNTDTPQSTADEEVKSTDAAGEMPGMATESTAPVSDTGASSPVTPAVSDMDSTSAEAIPSASSEPLSTAPVAAPRSKKKLWIALAIAGGIIIAAGAAAAAYVGVVLPNKPENMVKIAIGNTFLSEDVTSTKFSGKLDVDGKEEGSDFAATLEGATNNKGAFQFRAEGDFMVSKINAEVRSADGKTIYAKIGGLNGVADLMLRDESNVVAGLYATIMKSVNDKWYEFSPSFIKQVAGQELDLSRKLSAEDEAKLESAFRKYNFIKVTQVMADEKIAGVDTRHFKIALDQKELHGFLAELKKEKVEGFNFTDEQLNDIKNAKMPNYDLQVWIEKSTKRFRQITFSTTDEGTTYKTRLTMNEFNTPVSVAKPANAQPVAELLKSLFGSEDVTKELQDSFSF